MLSDNNNNIKDVFIVGDMNARFGHSIGNIPLSSNSPDIQTCSYPVIPDNINTANDNAHILSSICVNNNLVVLNNIKTPFCHFPSKKTFKRNGEWISELDTIVNSYGMLKLVHNFAVHQTDWLPSDRAPISVSVKLPRVNSDILRSRAGFLGGHAALMGHARQVRMVRRPVRFEQVNVLDFSNKIRDIPPPINENNDVKK